MIHWLPSWGLSQRVARVSAEDLVGSPEGVGDVIPKGDRDYRKRTKTYQLLRIAADSGSRL